MDDFAVKENKKMRYPEAKEAQTRLDQFAEQHGETRYNELVNKLRPELRPVVDMIRADNDSDTILRYLLVVHKIIVPVPRYKPQTELTKEEMHVAVLMFRRAIQDIRKVFDVEDVP